MGVTVSVGGMGVGVFRTESVYIRTQLTGRKYCKRGGRSLELLDGSTIDPSPVWSPARRKR